MLLEDAIEGCRNLYEPRWRAFERILAHAYLTGGGDVDDNLTAVCNDHHIAYIHLGYIRVYGAAPAGVIWELGCRPGQEPPMKLRGDFYMRK